MGVLKSILYGGGLEPIFRENIETCPSRGTEICLPWGSWNLSTVRRTVQIFSETSMPSLFRSLLSRVSYRVIARNRIILVSLCFSTFASLVLSPVPLRLPTMGSLRKPESKSTWNLVPTRLCWLYSGRSRKFSKSHHQSAVYALHMDTFPSSMQPTQFMRHFHWGNPCVLFTSGKGSISNLFFVPAHLPTKMPPTKFNWYVKRDLQVNI